MKNIPMQTLVNKLSKCNKNIVGCIHIGAHWGQEYQLYKRLGIDNLIFYEPIPSVFDILKRRVGPEVDLRNLALGNTHGYMSMYVEENNQGLSSSILEPGLHLEQYPHITFDSKIIVKISRLDDEPFERNQFNLLNIDVQGYELEVLRGAVSTLSSIDFILIEINNVEMYKQCVKVDDLDKFLGEFNFTREVTEWEQGIKNWGDALYWKNDG